MGAEGRYCGVWVVGLRGGFYFRLSNRSISNPASDILSAFRMHQINVGTTYDIRVQFPTLGLHTNSTRVQDIDNGAQGVPKRGILRTLFSVPCSLAACIDARVRVWD